MKTIIQNIKSNYKLVIGMLVLGVAIGWILTPSGGGGGDAHAGHEHVKEEPTTWTCSMHPQIKQDKFGLCPICAMDLIPLSSMNTGPADADPNEVVMSESAAALANVQTAVVASGVPTKSIYLQGKIHVDERRIAELTARFGGRIEELFINFTGQQVRKGQKLASIYSPELLSAQRELIEAAKIKESNPSLYKASLAKLHSWGISDEQIKAIEDAAEPMVNFDVLSPITGTVTMRHVALGDYIKEGTALFKVADLSKLWAMFDAYETDLPWIKIGDKVSFTMQALPGVTIENEVSYVDPIIDAKTRVAKLRVELDNKELKIKPEMYTRGVLRSRSAENTKAVLIPKSAVLWTGKRAVVYTKVPDRESPTFLYRQIVLGAETGDYYVVEEGLEVGEEIATNGVFKIDASAQLVGLSSMMNNSDTKSTQEAVFTVAGNCDMCKERIEKAAKTVFGVSSANWNASSQSITIKYDSENANVDAVQKAIAQAGHDTEKYKSSDEVYNELHSCCKYERLGAKSDNSEKQHAMFTVVGNCGMCEERIETAALSLKGVQSASWDSEEQHIHVNFVSPASNDAIQKAIAKAGHDTEKYRVSDEVYENLHGCCQYERLGAKSDNSEKQHAMFTVAGNCGMCKERIEAAALSLKGVQSASWDSEEQQIHVDFVSPATNDAIQQAIAKAGHDTEKYRVSDEVYENLHACCQYERLK